MIKVFEYSHLGGSEILQVRFPAVNQQIDDVIESIRDVRRVKKSKEKTKMGKMLYSPKDLNNRFKSALNAKGFQEKRVHFHIEIPGHNYVIRNSFKQVDFVKDKVLVEVQFGKYPFMFYDLFKFQYFFNEADAEVGVEIVPTHLLKKEMSTGVSYGEQLIYDVTRLRRHFPAVPVKMILVDLDRPPATPVEEEEDEQEVLAETTEDLESTEDEAG